MLVAINCLLAQSINTQNITTVKGRFNVIKVGVTRGDTSYNLYINENDNNYKIIADWSGCFQYSYFLNEVKQGDEITISFKNGNVFDLFKIIKVVSVVANNKTFMNMDCVNLHIEDDRTKIPLFCLAAIVFMWGYWFLRGTKLK